MNNKYFNLLKIKFMQEFNKYNNTKLLSAIIYSYSLLDPIDLNLFLIPKILLSDTSDISIPVSLSLFLLYSFISLNNIYNLPHMLDKPMTNKLPSLHTIFGETISQLASFCLSIETSNTIINSNIKDKTRILFQLIGNKMNTEQYKDYFNLNLEYIDLKESYNKNITKLLYTIILGIYIINKKDINNLNDLHKIVNLIILSYNNKKKYPNKISNTKYMIEKNNIFLEFQKIIKKNEKNELSNLIKIINIF